MRVRPLQDPLPGLAPKVTPKLTPNKCVLMCVYIHPHCSYSRTTLESHPFWDPLLITYLQLTDHECTLFLKDSDTVRVQDPSRSDPESDPTFYCNSTVATVETPTVDLYSRITPLLGPTPDHLPTTNDP